MKKVPIRMCLSCRERKEKKFLVRVVRTLQGTLEVDPTGKRAGRGAYVCPVPECVERLDRKSLSFAFRMEVSEKEALSLKEALRAYLGGQAKEVRHDKGQSV
ncbi:RNase P modulator RnpM [Candidatus Caldatribacterium sp. SIUC1]|uniref:RNase P modulator RnpM n=1 Tax=Candidatus Caldatribacterium sp. SIUC1 TaxID=3418365 RepID=UPI003F692F18